LCLDLTSCIPEISSAFPMTSHSLEYRRIKWQKTWHQLNVLVIYIYINSQALTVAVDQVKAFCCVSASCSG
jgi:hypothetical protein